MAAKISVLLIEDDIQDAELVERAFAKMPPVFELMHVERFFDAIQHIKAEATDVIILDLGLPDSVGLNGVERLMSLVPEVPIVVLTGSDDHEMAQRGIELGVQEFLDKYDLSPKQLLRSIRHAIKRKNHMLRSSSDYQGVMRRVRKDVAGFVEELQATELSAEQKSIVDQIESTTNELEKAVACQQSSQAIQLKIEAG